MSFGLDSDAFGSGAGDETKIAVRAVAAGQRSVAVGHERGGDPMASSGIGGSSRDLFGYDSSVIDGAEGDETPKRDGGRGILAAMDQLADGFDEANAPADGVKATVGPLPGGDG